MQLIKERASHWYAWDGEKFTSAHDVPNKSKPGEVRKTTLGDAKKLGLFPSVTNVLAIMSKPELERWKIQTAIEASLTLPLQPGEPLDRFADRVVADMDTQSEKAREFGTAIHEWIIAFLMGTETPAPELAEWTAGFREWALTNVESVIGVEQTVGNLAEGYAGRLDLQAYIVGHGRSVLDTKTQGIKPNDKGERKPNFYKEFPLQLAAYGGCVRQKGALPSLLTLVIDSGSPGPVHLKAWENGERHKAAWDHAFALWKYQKDYEPGRPL